MFIGINKIVSDELIKEVKSMSLQVICRENAKKTNNINHRSAAVIAEVYL